MAFGISAGGWLAAAATVGSAVISSNAAGDAADAQNAGTQAGIAENAREFDKIQENQKPWLEAGTTALGKLQTGVDTPLDQSNVMLDPGYQFGQKQGQLAIDRKTAAAGGRISGAALKAAAQFGNDYATTKYDAAYNRANQARSDRLNRLAALAGLGQTATGQVTSAGLTTAGRNSDLLSAQGNASGAARLAQGNIWGGAGNQLAALYGRSSGGSGGYGVPANPFYGDGSVNMGTATGDDLSLYY